MKTEFLERNFTHLKGARMQNYYDAWRVSDRTELSHCYGRYSDEKRAAYESCLRWVMDSNGYCGAIISFNTFSFTFGYLCEDEAGNAIFCVLTKSNLYWCWVFELVAE